MTRSHRLLRASAVIATVLGTLALASSAFADTAPSVTLSSSVTGATSDTSIPVTATFSAPVTSFSSGMVNSTNAGVSAFSGSGDIYTFNLIPNEAGSVTVSLPSGAGYDASGTPSLPSNMLNFTYSPTNNTGSSTNPAVISNVQVSGIASTTATITWDTDQPSDTQVFYGETSDYDASTPLDATYVTSHVAYLGGLVPSSTYHYEVASNDGAGVSTSPDAIFTTTDASGNGGGSGSGSGNTSSSTPLSLIGINTIQGNATADGTFTDGWQWDFQFLVPNNEPSLALQLSDFTSGGNTVPAANDIQYYSTESGNATSSASAITLGAANTFGTPLDLTNYLANSTSAGDTEVDVYVNVAVPSGTANGTYSASWTAQSTSTTP